MRLNHPLIFKMAGLLAVPFMRSWVDTLDCKFAFFDRDFDTAYPNRGEKRLYLFWHEYIFAPLNLRGRCDLTMLLSQHRDANIVQEMSDRFGFRCVRGSTNRGGARAIRELREAARTENLTIAADGPKGPRREMALGPIFLASRLQLPVVLLGLGYDRPWRASSWDHFAFPRPGSRVRAVIGGSFLVPPRADRDELEAYRRRSQEILTQLTTLAEDWAGSGRPMEGEYPVFVGPKASMLYPNRPNE